MNEGQVIPVTITDEIKTSFINYAMSVIVDRALPDVRDGLKPVQRRILYAMYQEGLFNSNKHAKSASVVGEVMKKYHPHGDSAIYDAMVRMGQDWNLRYMLVDKQGNFGSIDGDPAAAPRYTEARMSLLAEEMLLDIDKETVDFQSNYDETTEQPVALPSGFPNLIVNGASGIAVGMATNLAPHNLTEIIDGLLAMIENPTITLDEMMTHVKGPDFPTGGIMSKAGIRKAFETGRGGIRVRAKVRVEERNNRTSLVVTEIPYQVNKTSMIQTIAKLVRNKRIEDIAKYRDESDRQGMRIVFELKRNAHPELVLNQLYKYSQLQSTFSVNNVAIVDGSPKILPLIDMMSLYLKHRTDVVRRRSMFELRKAKERAHLLEGYLKALDHLDAIISLIRSSPDGPTARAALVETFGFTEIQAQAVLDLRLQRLTGLEREKIQIEYAEVQATIERLTKILEDKLELQRVIKTELKDIKKRFGDERRTQISSDLENIITKEDLIAEEDMVVTLTRGGYIKRTALTAYRAQSRGGRGVSAQKQKEDDINSLMIVGNTHEFLLFFTDFGRVFKEKIYDLPEAERAARGNHLRNILPLEENESVETVLSIEDFDMTGSLVFATRQGTIKKTIISDYSNLNAAGLIAINLADDDKLVSVRICDDDADIVLATHQGQAIRFSTNDVRNTGRATQGVRGIKLKNDDFVVSMVVIERKNISNTELLAVSEQGFGKRTKLEEYPTQGRGGQGVLTLKVTEKTGQLVSLLPVNGDEELLVLSEGGVLIRTRVSEISSYGRSSQGVTIMRLGNGDKVVAAMVMIPEEELDKVLDEVMESKKKETSATESNP